MKNRKVLFLTSLIALTSLAACSGDTKAPLGPDIIPEIDTSDNVNNVTKTYPDELLINHRIASVLVNEEYQLRPIRQLNYDGSNLSYISKDPSIATVDETGKIKGKASGETEILIADKDNAEFSYTLPVIVSPAITRTEDADAIKAELTAINEDNFNSLIDYEMYEKTLYKNGVQQSYDRYDQRMTISVEDAYLRIWETDAEIKTENGSIDFTNYEWIFYTNAFFDSYVYHQTGDVKNYFKAQTQSYMQKIDPLTKETVPGDRIDPLNDILDNLFVSGHEILDNTLDNGKISKFADMINADYSNVKNQFLGSRGSGEVLFGCDITFDNDTADQDDESRYGIPFGTPTPSVQTSRWVVKGGKLIAASHYIETTYEIGEDKYLAVYNIDHKFEEIDEQKSQIYVPNRKDYTEVDRLFSI